MKCLIRYICGIILLICNSILIGQQDIILDNEYKNKLLNSISDLIETKYVIPDIAKTSTDEFRKKVSGGYYDSIIDANIFTKQVTSDLVGIVGDKHIYFRIVEPEIKDKQNSSLHHPIRYHKLGAKENYGFKKLEILDGNIGLLELSRFYKYSDIKDMATNAIRFLSNTDAIIIDIRENGGGSGDYLSSYFLEYPTQLSSNYSREEDYLTEYWTIEDIGMEPMTEIPIFILTSDRTFSAAECFAYDMKVRGRAIIVGDSTKGGAHSVDLYNLFEQFEIYIPTMRAINPVTGSNWEGVGVIPDLTVNAESALDSAIVLATEAAQEFAKDKEENLKFAIQEMQSYLDKVESLIIRKKSKEANEALDSLLQIAEQNNIINEFFFHVWSYHYSSIDNEQMLYTILTKFLEYFPNSIMPYEKFIYAYNKFGKKDQALKFIHKTLEIDPYNQYALQMIARLKE